MRISLAALSLLAVAALASSEQSPPTPPAPTAPLPPHSEFTQLYTTNYNKKSNTSSVQQSDTRRDTNTTTRTSASATSPTTPTSSPSSSSSCPGGCECDDGLQKEYSCANGTLELVLQPREYLHIICHNSVSPPDPPPALPPQGVPSVSVSGCGPPAAARGGWAGYLQALGVFGVTSLTLRSPPHGATPLAPEHLRGLTEVTALSLLSAVPARLPAGLLAALPHLRRLKLRGVGGGGGDAPMKLLADTFAEAPLLEQLEVAMSEVSVVEADAFRGLGALRRLGVWATGLRALPPGALAGLAALQVLELRGNALSALPAGLLVGLGALQNLSLANNALAATPALPALPAVRLLDLSRNKIAALHQGDFASLSGLRSLNLDGNRIQELSDGVFGGLAALEELSMCSNGLRVISERAFLDTPALHRLLLDDNRLTLADSDPDPTTATATAGVDYWDFGRSSPFQSLMELRELSLKRNQVSRVSPDWRLVLLRLRRLDLAHNRLRALTEADLNFLSPNIEVDMRYNNITTVELTPPLPAEALEGDSTPGESGVTVLLDHNPLLCDCRMLELARRVAGVGPRVGIGAVRGGEARVEAGEARCSGPAALAQRLLSAVPLVALTCALPAAACPGACRCTLRPAADTLELKCARAPALAEWPDPRQYGVAGSALRLISPPTPPPLSLLALALPPHTHTLLLRALNLSVLEGAPPRSLALLDLRDNLLAVAPPALLAPDLMLRLQLAGNPLRCDCDHAEDLLLLQKNSHRVDEWSELRCERGEGGSGAGGARLVVGGVSTQALCAARNLALRLGAVLAALAALVALAGALCWRHRLLVRAVCAARCPAWCRWRKRGDDAEEKEYDAFVSYSHADEEWVLGALVARLERAGRRLCVHCRDWVPGELIPAQIARSVRRSRRTLVVLSPAYLQSAWAREEWRAACEGDGGGGVLVVLLGAVRREELSAELRAHLAANTYVKVGDPWLWEKLLYAIPARVRAQDPASAPDPAPAEARLAALKKGFDDRIEGLAPPAHISAPAPAPAGPLCARLTPAGLLVNDAKVKDRL